MILTDEELGYCVNWVKFSEVADCGHWWLLGLS